jgi:ornithine cyclodeaminase
MYDAIREALIAVASNDGILFPVTQGQTSAWSMGVKGGYVASAEALGFKFGGYWPGNREHGLASHSSTTVLIDPATGYPEALVNASFLNCLRTAAADAVAVDALARKDAASLCVLGAGHQSEFEIRAIADVRDLRLVKLWNRSPHAAGQLRAALCDLDMEIMVAEREEAIAGADIVVTVSASREPLVRVEEIAPGTHLSAMGADQPGKQELAADLVAQGKLFTDRIDQSISIGEFQHAVQAGLIAASDITPLGLVLSGAAPGRTDPSQITIFDSSGVAYQDLLAARAVLEAAGRAGLLTEIDL